MLLLQLVWNVNYTNDLLKKLKSKTLHYHAKRTYTYSKINYNKTNIIR